MNTERTRITPHANHYRNHAHQVRSEALAAMVTALRQSIRNFGQAVLTRLGVQA